MLVLQQRGSIVCPNHTMKNTSKLLLTATIGILVSLIFTTFLNSSKQPNTQTTQSLLLYQGTLEILPLGDAVGPESLAFDPTGGGPYTGVSGGRILKWVVDQRQWVEFAVTSTMRDGCNGQHDYEEMEHICGRPLGLCFNSLTGDLYIADAYMGLLVAGPNGGLATPVLTEAQGIHLAFTNNLDIDQSNSVVYFTDSSSQFQRRNYMSVILSGEKAGRLMKYDPQSKQVTVLLDNLSFPNGVAISKDGNSVLIAETTKCRVLRYWLKTSKAGTFEVFSELPGFPDNIQRSPRGGYWVGIFSKKVKAIQWILSYPSIGKTLLRLPFDLSKSQAFLAKWRKSGMAVRLSEQGEILERFEGAKENKWTSVSEVNEVDGSLWIGSVNMPFVGNFKM